VDLRNPEVKQVGVYPFAHPERPSYYVALYERAVESELTIDDVNLSESACLVSNGLADPKYK